MLSSIAAGAASKAVATWVGAALSTWLKDRNSSAEEAREWVAISTAVLKQTKAMATRYAKITTVAFPREPVLLDSIYVPLTLIGANQEQIAVIDKFPKELFLKQRKIMVVDVAGMGKSTISKVLYLKALEEKCQLPILIDLRRLDGTQSIETSLANQFGLRPKQLELFSEFLRSQPLLYLFDGFDEISDSKKLEVARVIRQFVDLAENASFVMTSRPGVPFSDYTDFVTLHIQELSREQAHSLIQKYGVAYGIESKARALLDELKARHDGPVASFLKNPLLSSLLFRAFEYKSVVPVKRGIFYRQVFDALYESHDLNKETGFVREKKTGLHQDDFHRALRGMAKLFRQRQVVEVNEVDFLAMAKEISTSLCSDLSFSPEAFIQDVTDAVPIFSRDGKFVRWSHKSLLDYFLSEFLLRDYSESKEEVLMKTAAGWNSRKNENFLVLVHEADPILFTKSVTLPSIDALIAMHGEILDKLPADMDAKMAGHAATFFLNYDVVIAGDDIWSGHVENPDSSFLSGLHDFVPQMIYGFGGKSLEVGFFARIAADALRVPMILGTVPYQRIYEIGGQYPKLSLKDFVERFSEPTIVFTDRKKWESFEEDLQGVLGAARNLELNLLTIADLKKSKRELEKLVATSIKARSNEVF